MTAKRSRSPGVRLVRRAGLGLAFFFLILSLSAAPPDDDPFADGNKATPGKPAAEADPFAQTNQQGAKAAPPKPTSIPTADRIDFQAAVTPERARRGETVKLTITGTPRPGYHTYPLTQRSADPAQDELGLSKLIYEDTPGLKPLPPVSESTPEFVTEQGVGVFLEHRRPFTWSQDVLVLPDAAPGRLELRFRVKLQVCNGNCVWGEPPFAVPIEVTDAPPLALTPQLRARLQAGTPSVQAVAVPANLAAQPAAPTDTPPAVRDAAAADTGLLRFILMGIGWGAISVFTPCVFPMIPITVSFFLKQSEKQHHRPVTMALVYCATIVTVLTVSGVLLIPILQPFSQHWATNFALGGLFLFFALSLLGMFEITLPQGLANLTSAREGQGGLVGTMFMALTFTIISFTCVAPFYGSFIALSAAAQSVTAWLKLVSGALAFSATFASPFFVLALFPSMLRKLPKSGSWMNTIKVVMGFLEIAAAVKFLRAGELNFLARAEFLTYDLALGVYVALALLCGLYLLNLYRLPHDEPLDHLGVPRLLVSLAFLSLGFYLLPGLFKSAGGEPQRPKGAVFAWLDSFLLPEAPEAEGTASAGPTAVTTAAERRGQGRLVWGGNLERTLREAEDKRKLVFVDFTGLT